MSHHSLALAGSVLAAIALASPSCAQASLAASDTLTWLSVTPRWSHGQSTETYDVGATVGDPTGPVVFTFGVGLRVIDFSDVEPSTAADPDTLFCCTGGFAVHLSAGWRVGQSPLVVRAGVSGWIPPVLPEGFAGGGDLRAEVALVPRNAGLTLSAGVFVSGATGSRVDLGDRGVTVSLGYQFVSRDSDP